MKMKKAALAVSALLMTSTSVMAEFSGNVALTTNYIFRGISQNDNSFAIQGGFDYEHESGFYAGIWASNVDDEFFAGSSIEIDTYLGWAGTVGPVDLDVGYVRYNYPDSDENDPNIGYETDTDEFHVGISKDFGVLAAGFTVNYSPDFFDVGDGMYYDLGIDVPVGSFTISAHYGVTDIDEKSGLPDLDYEDWKLGVSTEYAGFGFDLSYTDTADDGLCDGTPAVCGDHIAFTVSKSL
ncbi:TorF family putative porin [Thiosocius teredinicola]|uniref:TorF family putative porin n=1 Tax=Thiosocius teredinicola TaxID=1973002 RepID=UPI000990C56E